MAEVINKVETTDHVCYALVHSQRVIEEIEDHLRGTPVFSRATKFHGQRFVAELHKATDDIYKGANGSDMSNLFNLHINIQASIDELNIEQKEILMNALPVLVKEIQEHGALFINGNNVRLNGQ